MMNKKLNKIWKTNSKTPFLIAEIGGNHEGDFTKALELTKLAIKSKVDCIKYQIYDADSIVNKKLSPERNKHFKKFELSIDHHIELAKICKKNKVFYSASIWNLDSIDIIDQYIDFYKIGSGDLTAYPFLKKIAMIGKPIILSTGLSNQNEVFQAINFIQKTNAIYKSKDNMGVLQCTSMYPIMNTDVNLNVMKTYKDKTSLAVGYSDHTIGIEAIKTAIIMNADIIEFHFTDNDSRINKKFRDHQVSLTIEEITELRKFIYNTNLIKGENKKKLLKIETENNHDISFRRGVFLRNGKKKGEIINENDLIFLRPAIGTDAREYKKLIGAITIKDIKPLDKLIIDVDYKI